MRIFVTGATGFIGKYVLNHCLSQGFDVLAHRRKSLSDFQVKRNNNVEWLEMSLSDLRSEHLNGVEAIIHLAATGVSPRLATWNELEEINIRGTLNICMLAKSINARIAIAGSYAEYGNSGLRFVEIPVNAPLEPTFPYASSKASACHLALGFARAEGLKLAYLRVFNAYGDGQHDTNLWPSLRKAANSGANFRMTKGEQVRDFIAVEDVALCFVNAIAHHDLQAGKPWVSNVASGSPQTVRLFCENWWNLFNARGDLDIGAIPYGKNEVMRYVPCMSPAFL